jgi:hypothetical protein
MRYKEMMNEERVMASPFYPPTLSTLYLALPKLDLPLTHIPGGMRFHLHQGGMRRRRGG